MVKNVHEQRNAWVIGSVLLIVFFGVFFIGREIFRVEDSRFTYNNVDFTRVRDGTIERFQFPIYVNSVEEPIMAEIRSDPRVLVNISVDTGVRESLLSKKKVFVTMNISSSGFSVAAFTELKFFLNNPALWQINTTGAFTSPSSTYPVITCADANAQEGVVEFVVANESKIVYDHDCVRLLVPLESDLFSVTDKLILVLLGIDK